MKRTVLIVDDSETIRYLARVYLSGLGFELREAVNGLEAFAAVMAGGVDLVLADLNMPQVDGLEFLRRLRSHHDPAYALLPVVILTMDKCPDKRAAVLDAGANEYLLKPVTTARLREVVQQFLPSLMSQSG